MELKKLFEENKISRINEFEIERYLNFFSNSYKDNLEHSEFNLEKFPRWSIISGYYAMHDISKLFIAKKFLIKVNLNVHSTTIILLEEIIKDKEIIKLIKEAYSDFNDLSENLKIAKKKRVKSQYFTGSEYSKELFKKISNEFHSNIVLKFIKKIEILIEK